jgi:hypothetical protein
MFNHMLRVVLIGASLLLATDVHAARVYLDPDAGTFGLGDTFIVSVRLETEDECINTASVTLDYPLETLDLVDFSKGKSIFTLWVDEPKPGEDTGRLTFSGGVPGGYCGRISGDPAQSNVLARIVFKVVQATQKSAAVRVAPTTEVYLSDGLGTRAPISVGDAQFAIVSYPTLPNNIWLEELSADEVPPEAFEVQVGSTPGFFGGKYYLIFSTVDKQSGVDHFEMYDAGGWKIIESPHYIRSPLSNKDVKIRAVDKNGNERLGDFNEETVALGSMTFFDVMTLVLAVVVLLGVGAVVRMRWFQNGIKTES